MTVFPTAAHLVSWAKWCPQVARSGGKRKGSNATGRGNRHLSAALGEASMGAGRTGSFPGARYRRLNKRMPKRKALVATGNSILTIYHALLSDPAASYCDLGPGYYDQRAGVRRQARNHLKNLERLGCKVTIEPLTPGTARPCPLPANKHHPDNRRRSAPPTAAACPPKAIFSDQNATGQPERAAGQAGRVLVDPGPLTGRRGRRPPACGRTCGAGSPCGSRRLPRLRTRVPPSGIPPAYCSRSGTGTSGRTTGFRYTTVTCCGLSAALISSSKTGLLLARPARPRAAAAPLPRVTAQKPLALPTT